MKILDSIIKMPLKNVEYLYSIVLSSLGEGSVRENNIEEMWYKPEYKCLEGGQNVLIVLQALTKGKPCVYS